ncbi:MULTISPECIES: fimbrial protein [Providencia]|nr:MULTISPECIES: fimbrial protein [Providencia]MCB4854522.1 fimbrial protein [Providencia rettgeri]MCD6313431.1 fimbrial protein [Providencia rettgeri]MCG9517284.1 fimbrial protein [Providencia rettgeri]MCG9532754.1 fimbrial protein [Providencia rettgeri]MCL0009633.1 fimbrial protein [Providencia rettgeri]
MMKTILYKLSLLFGCLFFYSYASYAACLKGTYTAHHNIPDRTIYVQYDNLHANNYVLASHSIRAFTADYYFAMTYENDCGGYLDVYYVNGWSANSSKIAPTNIPGVGIRIKFFSAPLPGYIPTRSATIDTSYALYNSSGYHSWEVEILKIGTIANSGVIRSGGVANLTQYNTKVGTRFLGATLGFGSNYRIAVVSCSLKNNQSTYNINMKEWYDTQFSNIGSTSTPVDIPITLTCAAGSNIKATVTSSKYEDTVTGKLGLTGTNSATGIAIQLLDKNNNPIKLNVKNSLQNNVPSGDYMFNWKARYIKTAANITPGTANASATVNIRYE